MKLVNANQMRELEKHADASGNSYAMMMERAGKAVADAISERWGARGKRVLVLVGPGNNGGDGLVCARYLHDAGANVSLYAWKRTPSNADENYRMCAERKIAVHRAEEDSNFDALRERINHCEIIVDALLGTGVARPIEGMLKDLLGVVKETLAVKNNRHLVPLIPSLPAVPSPLLVAAVDLPSGLNPDTGALDPATLPADLTVTFAFPKIGQLAFPGANAVGELIVADIGIRAEWADANLPDVATAREIASILPARARNSHKGTFGKAMLCVGSLNYVGAAYLAGSAATRAGAGLVTLALAHTIYPMLASASHETTFVPLPDENGALTPSAVAPLIDASQDYDVLLIGCGFGRSPKTIEFVRALLDAIHNSQLTIRNLVFDADGLYALAQAGEWWKKFPPNSAILTPHPGEFATLTGLARDEIQTNRIEAAKKFAAQWNQIVVLKGAFTVIASPQGQVTILPFATPALATAGTGDVLAGTITAMLAQKLSPYEAAIAGTYVHGLAGEIAEKEIGRAGVVAGDLLPRLPKAIAVIQQTRRI